jgi:predicted nucleic acid-binding Zn ribbon protein
MEKVCPECGEKIIGRIDKIFCSDQCRNTHNNRQNRAVTNYIRTVNRKLQNNRRILAKLAPDGKATVHKDTLLKEGFDLSFFTNTYTTKARKVYYYCYEMGYLPIDNSFYVVVRKDD